MEESRQKQTACYFDDCCYHYVYCYYFLFLFLIYCYGYRNYCYYYYYYYYYYYFEKVWIRMTGVMIRWKKGEKM